MSKHSLSAKIKHARTFNSFSQQELANRVGVTRTTVSLWETKGSSTQHPHRTKLSKLAEATGYPLNWFHDDDAELVAPDVITMIAPDPEPSKLPALGETVLEQMFATLIRDIIENSPQGERDIALNNYWQSMASYRGTLLELNGNEAEGK